MTVAPMIAPIFIEPGLELAEEAAVLDGAEDVVDGLGAVPFWM